jgi:hypothetical protein
VEPKKVDPLRKSTSRGENAYLLTLSESRITIYHWHDKDSESVEFGGTAEDFNQFDEENPEEWFSLAAKIIEKRSKE